MLQTCLSGGSSRCTWRALLVLLAWVLLMIATVQLRNAPGYSETDSLVSNLDDRQLYPPESELLIDHRSMHDETELIREVEENIPSLPIGFWSRFGIKQQVKSNKSGNNCRPHYPSIFELEFNNIYWQTLRSSNGTFQLFGAFYDERRLSRIGPALRIVGMIDRIEPNVRTYCHMWWEHEKDACIVEVFEYKYIWYSKWGNYRQGIYQPYIIACKLPHSHLKRGPPISVSLVENRCETASNNLRVTYNRPPKGHKRDFAVCVKGLDFLHEDLSIRLIEWIELLGLLGADKIFFL